MANTASTRQQALTSWVNAQLGGDFTLTPIASDAGFRRYFRFATPSQWLAVDAPPATEDSRQFVALAQYLSAQGVGTPRILAVDEAQGFLLVEDFGDDLLFAKLTPKTADSLYRQAFTTLIDIQHCPHQQTLIPPYDQALLHRELCIFSEWFVTQLLGYALNAQENTLLASLFSKLETTALTQPQTLVHRDFHSRNLLLRPHAGLGVIDFQGALWGACTYDVVSLLRDCYKRWPAAQVTHWALVYRQQAIAAGVLSAVSEAEFLRWFDYTGLQRHIKVLGIFARLHLRDGKNHYLHDLPLVIGYTLEVAEQYAELHAFADWFNATLLPLAATQTWYRDYRSAGDEQ
jgi:N-acetylmuramate 1-kinase